MKNPLWLIATCASISVFDSAELIDSIGQPVCECVENIWTKQLAYNDCPRLTDPRGFTMKVFLNGTFYCYPPEYGELSCQRWDDLRVPWCANFDGTRIPNRPQWCDTPWCLVSPDCPLEAELTQTYTGNLDMIVMKSSKTCDSDSYSPQDIGKSLQNKTIRVFFMEYEQSLMFDNATKRYSGYLWDFLDEIKQRAGFEWEVMTTLPISDEETMKYGLHHACLLNVEAGGVDLCASTYLVTGTRMQRVEFTLPLQMSTFYAITLKKKKETFLEQMWHPFSVFSHDLWLVIIAINLTVGYMVYLFENECRGYEGMVKGLHNMCDAIYESFSWFWSSGVGYEPVSFSTRLILYVYALFIMLIISAYTANLASKFVTSAGSSIMTSMEDAISKQLKICTWYSAIELMKIRYHRTVLQLMHVVASNDDGIDKIESGVCDAFVNGKFYQDQELSKKRNCDKMLVTKPIFTIPLSMPVRTELKPGFDYFISFLNEEGRYEHLQKARAFTDECDRLANIEDPEDQQKLELADLGGAFVVLLLVVIVALMFRCVRACISSKDKKRLSTVFQKARASKDRASTLSDQENSVFGKAEIEPEQGYGFDDDEKDRMKDDLRRFQQLVDKMKHDAIESTAFTMRNDMILAELNNVRAQLAQRRARTVDATTQDNETRAKRGPSEDNTLSRRTTPSGREVAVPGLALSVDKKRARGENSVLRGLREEQGSDACADNGHANVCNVIEAMFSMVGFRCLQSDLPSVQALRGLGSKRGLWFGDVFVEGYDRQGRMTMIDVFIGTDENVKHLEYAASLNFHQSSFLQSHDKIASAIHYEVFGVSPSGSLGPRASGLINECAIRFAGEGGGREYTDSWQADFKERVMKDLYFACQQVKTPITL